MEGRKRLVKGFDFPGLDLGAEIIQAGAVALEESKGQIVAEVASVRRGAVARQRGLLDLE